MIDCHAHLLPEKYLECLREHAETDPSLGPTLDWYDGGFQARLPEACTRYFFGDLRGRVDVLDGAGVDCQLISPATILAFPPETIGRVELVAAWNDAVSAEAVTSGDRIKVLFGVPLPDVEASIRETERMLALGTTAGVAMPTHVNGISLVDPRWDELYEVWDAHALTVFVHPSDFRVPKLFDPLLSKDLGTQVEDTLAAIDLYESDVAIRFPRISWVIAHLGGVLSFLLGRFDEHWERDRDHRPLGDFPSRSLDGLYFDTAGHDEDAIEFAARKLGHDKLVLGSDFPMVASDDYPALVQRVKRAIGENHISRVFDTNARQLFRV
jgi:predicted TIM-barrel fold metal-dependent hydrolase